MKIEIWSDYVCPFCYIGERKLIQALTKTGKTDEVEIIFNSFELNPNAEKSYDVGINQLLADKYGMSIERAEESNRHIIQAAKNLGLEFNFENLKPTNTFDAHRVSFYAKSVGKLKEYTEVVMRSYFTDSLNISDFNVITTIAKEVGLDVNKVLEILNSEEFTDQVRADEKSAYEKNISGVPYFLFNGKDAISGAQDVSVFVDLINKIG
ncbi:MAG: DsbA family oxidoreductase [Spirochaetaceae bacterium]